jgi:hypothetical protein
MDKKVSIIQGVVGDACLKYEEISKIRQNWSEIELKTV